MASPLETVVIVEADSAVRDRLYQILQEAGYDVRPAATPEEGFRAVLSQPPDVFILSTSLDDSRATNAISEIKELSATSQVHVIVLTNGGPAERARALQTGADDVVSAPWDEAELLARVRTQLRHKRATEQLALKVHNAEESYQVAQTAFQALAVTEKMTRDAFSLERILKIGVVSLFSIALVIAGIFFLFSRKAEKETRRAYSVIAQLERGVKNEEQLLESARRLREDPEQCRRATAKRTASGANRGFEAEAFCAEW